MLTQASAGAALRLAAGLIPDFSLLDHFGRYVNGGGALGATPIIQMALYGALWTAIFGVLAAARFRRMAL